MIFSVALLGFMCAANAQINIGKATGAVTKGAQALTFSNQDAINLSKEAVDWMDKNNPVPPASDPYVKRLNKIIGSHTSEDGLKLNYKVYDVVDINAFRDQQKKDKAA